MSSAALDSAILQEDLRYPGRVVRRVRAGELLDLPGLAHLPDWWPEREPGAELSLEDDVRPCFWCGVGPVPAVIGTTAD